MKATEITLTVEQLAKKLMTSYALFTHRFKTQEQHFEFCFAIQSLVGRDMYSEICAIVEKDMDAFLAEYDRNR